MAVDFVRLPWQVHRRFRESGQIVVQRNLSKMLRVNIINDCFWQNRLNCLHTVAELSSLQHLSQLLGEDTFEVSFGALAIYVCGLLLQMVDELNDFILVVVVLFVLKTWLQSHEKSKWKNEICLAIELFSPLSECKKIEHAKIVTNMFVVSREVNLNETMSNWLF